MLCWSLVSYSQHKFPSGHFCGSPEGAQSIECQAIQGIMDDTPDKVVVFPHRGVWGEEGVPDLSMKALENAYREGYLFCEIDLMLTKDNCLVLFHDQQTNKATNAPPTFSTDGGVIDPGNFVRSLNMASSTTNSVPDPFGINYSYFPPLNDLYLLDRFGDLTTERMTTFEHFCLKFKDAPMVFSLDFKAVNLNSTHVKQEYMDAIKEALKIGKKYNMLYKLIFKPGSSGDLSVQELKDVLLQVDLWDDFAYHTNLILVDVFGSASPLAYNKEYIDSWLAIPSLIGVEYIYKDNDDEFLKKKEEFGNMSIIEYTKSKGIKTGVFRTIPGSAIGVAGGRGNYFNPSSFNIKDVRGNLEFLFNVGEGNEPSMIVTDRPDMDLEFLKAFGKASRWNKR